MAPVALNIAANDDISEIKAKLAAVDLSKVNLTLPPENTIRRYHKAGIDLSGGYPYFPPKPDFVQDVFKVREDVRNGKEYVDPATRADPEKKALFGAATSVTDLTTHIGTEITGLQLKDLTEAQKDELALLVSERHIVFFRDQDISPQEQKQLGLYLGDGAIETHVQAAQVPGVGGGVSLIWEDGRKDDLGGKGRSWRVPYGGGSFGWHTDLVHEPYPPGYTHLHQDTVPAVGGDTLWASGFAAYDKLSPAFRKILDGLNGIYRSAHTYKNTDKPDAPPAPVLRTHPLVRTHPVTGWKSLYVNRAMTVGIEGFDQPEADVILNHLHDVFERSTDIQLRWHWTPGTSAIWDNRSTIHTVSYDYQGERHGTRVSSLAEKPYYDPNSKSRAEALGLDKWLNSPYFQRY